MKSVVVVTGTRPEIIKMAPILRVLNKRKIPTTFIHCGQHYDYNMAQQFIENLELPAPEYSFKVKTASPAMQTARIMAHMDKFLQKIDPAIVLVEGDTNTVLAAGLASNKRGIAVGHVEAGLRSFDLRMPEEHNRRLTDHLSNYLFAPTNTAKRHLKNEKVWGEIFVTGNTVIDAVNEHMLLAYKKSDIIKQINFEKFVLATAHRAENVDNIEVLKNFIGAFAKSPLPVIYPMHPRTKKRLKQNGLYTQVKKLGNVQILPPLGYLDFLVLMKKSELILTDSGGIQEEATAPTIRKPVLVMRLSTERPEAVEAGFAKIIGTKENNIVSALKETLKSNTQLPMNSPFGDGHAAEKIVDIVKEKAFTS